MSGKKFPVFNPATEEKLCEVEEGDKVGFAAHRPGFFVGQHPELPNRPQLVTCHENTISGALWENFLGT